MKKNITLSVDKDIYDKFTKFCNKKGMIRSMIIENLIKDFIRNVK